MNALEAAEKRMADLQDQMAHDPATHAYNEVTAWARDWRSRLNPETPYGVKRQALHQLGLRVFVAPIEPDAAHPKRDRHFVVVVGRPQGVKQAIPWAVLPLIPGGQRQTPTSPNTILALKMTTARSCVWYQRRPWK